MNTIINLLFPKRKATPTLKELQATVEFKSAPIDFTNKHLFTTQALQKVI